MTDIPAGPRPDCPVCGQPCKVSVRRPVFWLLTCGSRACGYEMRARGTRGRIYGNTGGGPGRNPQATHGAIHARARRAFRGLPCALADATCSGRVEAALRAEFPRSLLTVDPRTGSLFYAGPNTEDAYRPLCRSHHSREGALIAAAGRSPRVAAAVVADRIRNEHGDCSPFCGPCGLIATLDSVLEVIVDYETRVMTERAMRA